MDDTIYLIGGEGGAEQSLGSQSVLRIATYSLKELQWTAKIINGNRALNRSFHASTVVGSNKIFTFGGCTSLGNLGEILSVTSSAEEVTCEICQANNVSLKGLSASTLGLSSKTERVVLYGGLTDINEYTSECLVFDPTADSFKNSKVAIMQTESESPPPRAFHSAVVCGESRQYLIIHGGRGRTGLLSDIWILDASSLFSPVEQVQVDPKAKGGKGGKAAPTPSLPFWCQVALNSPLNPRCLHSSSLTTTDRSFTLHTFGGVGDQGIFPIEISSTQISQEGPNKFTGTHTSPDSIPQEQESRTFSKRYAFSSCEIIENENPVAIFVFGGVQNLQSHSTALPELMILEKDSAFSAHALPLLPELSPSDKTPLDESVGHIEYPSGDIYDGEVLKEEDVTYRHGLGKLLYANGSVYEVGVSYWLFLDSFVQGSWERDIRQGTGSYTSCDENEKYTGEFKEGEYHGRGSLHLIQPLEGKPQTKTILEYEGMFDSSVFHGHGLLKDSAANTTYRGDFCHGVKSGHGILTRTSDGCQLYDGEWSNGVPSGRGTYMLEGGHIYTGEIHNGLPHGEGHCRYVDGSEYTGAWKTGRRNGNGFYIGAALDEYKGKWVGDMRSGKGVWKSARGDCYDGVWDRDLPHGKGNVTYNLGENCADPSRERSYNGNWDHGKRSGQGEVTYANGVTKKGSWDSTTKDIAFVEDN